MPCPGNNVLDKCLQVRIAYPMPTATTTMYPGTSVPIATARAVLRAWASQGGQARAEALSAAERTLLAKRAATARWDRDKATSR